MCPPTPPTFSLPLCQLPGIVYSPHTAQTHTQQKKIVSVCLGYAIRNDTTQTTNDMSARTVLWDVQNVPLTRMSPCDVAIAFGDATEYRAYADCKALTDARRHAIARMWTLIDCPRKNEKQSVDLRLQCDAFHVTSCNNNRDIVIITGDGDFVSTIASLRHRSRVTIAFDETVGSVCADLLSIAHATFTFQEEDEAERTLATEFANAVRMSMTHNGEWVSGTSVGEVFHHNKGKPKHERKADFRSAARQALLEGLIEQRDGCHGHHDFRLSTRDDVTQAPAGR